MAQFVRVSGYGNDDIEKARQQGMDDFLAQAVCGAGFGQQVYVETNTSSTYTFFTNKVVSKHSILIMMLSAASQNATSSTDTPKPEITLTAQNGTARLIKYNDIEGYKSGELDMCTRYAFYEITAGTTISATYQVTGRGSNVVGIAFLIDA